jgi:hypothetical protein
LLPILYACSADYTTSGNDNGYVVPASLILLRPTAVLSVIGGNFRLTRFSGSNDGADVFDNSDWSIVEPIAAVGSVCVYTQQCVVVSSNQAHPCVSAIVNVSTVCDNTCAALTACC